MNGLNWSYDPREGFAIAHPSLLFDHGHYECYARSNSVSNKKQSLGFLLIVRRKFFYTNPLSSVSTTLSVHRLFSFASLIP